MLRQWSLICFVLVRSLAMVCTISLAVSLSSCGGGGSSGSSSGSETLTNPAITTLAPLDSVTDQQALLAFVESGGLPSCYPGSTLTYSAWEVFMSNADQVNVKSISPSTLTWSTSDSKIATVTNGVVTCVADGTARITATVANATCENGCMAQAGVLVGSSKDTLTLTPASGTFKVGDTVNFTATLNSQFPGGSTTTQDVSTSVGIPLSDTANGAVLTGNGTGNQFKAAHSGTVWGFAIYQFADHSAVSNVFTITVQ